MRADLERFATHCEQMAVRGERERPRLVAEVAAGGRPAGDLHRHDRTLALWVQLAAEIRTHLTTETPTDHDLEEPLWETA